jgi:microcystin-dependent protein
MENLKVLEGLSLDSINGIAYSPGDIIMLNSDIAPDGFLSCDGSTITSITYPALVAALGTYYDTALTVCKLPNLNQSTWLFPCGTVGNAAAYPAVTSSHSHTTTASTINTVNYATTAHNHTVTSNSNNSNANHSHGAINGGPAVNVSSNLANRSNGSGQGVNLAIYGHTHAWGANANAEAVNETHFHGTSIVIASVQSNHSHVANLSTSASSNEYIPDNVVLLKYYIKY